MQASGGRNQNLPPGPEGRRIRNLVERSRDFRGLMRRYREEYGNIVYYSIPGFNFCALFDVDLIREVLVEKVDNFPPFRDSAGYGIIKAECMPRDHGEHHLRVREVFGGAFVEDRMCRYADLIADNIREMKDRWRTGQIIDYKAEAGRLTCSALLDSLLGCEPRVPPEVAWDAAGAIKRDWGMSYLPGSSVLKRLPLPGNRRARRAIQVMDDAVYGAMRKARDASHNGADMASHVVRTADAQENCPFTGGDRELRDELYMIVLGSIDSPMMGLVWSLELLDQHPAVRERLEKEVDEVLGDRPITGADFDKLPYTRSVAMESFRLKPPSYAGTSHWRSATEDCVIGGYRIPAGTIAQPCLGEAHRDPARWERPSEFVPERWLAQSEPDGAEHAYIPFFIGPHTCLGAEFATILVVLALASCAQGMRIELLSPTPFKAEFLGLGVKGPIQARVRERRPAA